jgi:hypothetical protein
MDHVGVKPDVSISEASCVWEIVQYTSKVFFFYLNKKWTTHQTSIIAKAVKAVSEKQL